MASGDGLGESARGLAWHDLTPEARRFRSQRSSRSVQRPASGLLL